MTLLRRGISCWAADTHQVEVERCQTVTEHEKNKWTKGRQVLRDRRRKWRIEDLIYWMAAALISETGLRTWAEEEEIPNKSGGDESTWDVERAKHKLFVFSRDGTNQMESHFWWGWEGFGNVAGCMFRWKVSRKKWVHVWTSASIPSRQLSTLGLNCWQSNHWGHGISGYMGYKCPSCLGEHSGAKPVQHKLYYNWTRSAVCSSSFLQEKMTSLVRSCGTY